METLLDHVILTVEDLERSIAFYETALRPLGIVHAIDYDGKDGPQGHPDLKGLRMPNLSGVQATRQIRREFPGALIIVLTTYEGDEDIHRALEAGGHG